MEPVVIHSLEHHIELEDENRTVLQYLPETEEWWVFAKALDEEPLKLEGEDPDLDLHYHGAHITQDLLCDCRTLISDY